MATKRKLGHGSRLGRSKRTPDPGTIYTTHCSRYRKCNIAGTRTHGLWAVGSDPTFLQLRFSHPISHRTPHYRVGNGGIGWLVISQKRLNVWMKRNCKIQGKMGCNGLGNRCPSQKKYEPKLRDIAPAESEGPIFGTGDDYRPQAADRCRVFRISQTHAVCRRDSGTRRSSAVGLHAILLGHPLGHKVAITKRPRIT